MIRQAFIAQAVFWRSPAAQNVPQQKFPRESAYPTWAENKKNHVHPENYPDMDISINWKKSRIFFSLTSIPPLRQHWVDVVSKVGPELARLDVTGRWLDIIFLGGGPWKNVGPQCFQMLKCLGFLGMDQWMKRTRNYGILTKKTAYCMVAGLKLHCFLHGALGKRPNRGRISGWGVLDLAFLGSAYNTWISKKQM